MPRGRPGEALASACPPAPRRVTGVSGLPAPSAHQVSNTHVNRAQGPAERAPGPEHLSTAPPHFNAGAPRPVWPPGDAGLPPCHTYLLHRPPRTPPSSSAPCLHASHALGRCPSCVGTRCMVRQAGASSTEVLQGPTARPPLTPRTFPGETVSIYSIHVSQGLPTDASQPGSGASTPQTRQRLQRRSAGREAWAGSCC